MTAPSGRRAANHAATHRAIADAAARLFGAQGFDATSVRQIAEAAGIGERTFYRYYDGKDALLAGEVDAWLARLVEAIAAQPPGTPMVAVVRDAFREIRAPDGRTPAIGWLLGSEPRPLELLRRSAPRPLRRFERAIEGALLARARAEGVAERPLHADLAARVCVAIVRSAATQARAATESGSAEQPFWEALDRAFATLDELLGERPQGA